MYNLFDSSYEFVGKRVRVNSCLITSKADLVSTLRSILSRLDYSFNNSDRPTPAWLYNWRQMDYNYLRNALEHVVRQACSLPLTILRECRLESDGFHFIDYNHCDLSDSGRVCHIHLQCDQTSKDFCVSLKDVPVYISDFYERPYTNRIITIS